MIYPRVREAGYLDAELSYLREAGREFVLRNPGAAERLQWGADGRCDDPHVRRMIEAFALLSARVRAKLDDEFPELTHALLEALYPHFLRPIPSLSVVQFLPRRDTSVRSTVPRGSEVVLDVANADTRCRFRTMYPVEVWPVQVVLSELQTGRLADRCGPGVKSVLSVRLRCARERPSRTWARSHYGSTSRASGRPPRRSTRHCSATRPTSR